MNSLAFAVLIFIGFSTIMVAASEPAAEKHCGTKLRNSMKFFCQPHIKEMIRNGYFGPFTRPSKRALAFASLDNLMRTSYSNEDNDAFDVYEQNDEPMNVYDMLMNQKRQDKSTITSLCCKQECSLPTLITFCPS